MGHEHVLAYAWRPKCLKESIKIRSRTENDIRLPFSGFVHCVLQLEELHMR